MSPRPPAPSSGARRESAAAVEGRDPSAARRRHYRMTRFEVTTAVHSALQQSDLSLTLVAIHALPFAWELRFEDGDGVERVITVHQGSAASITDSITNALQCHA